MSDLRSWPLMTTSKASPIMGSYLRALGLLKQKAPSTQVDGAFCFKGGTTSVSAKPYFFGGVTFLIFLPPLPVPLGTPSGVGVGSVLVYLFTTSCWPIVNRPLIVE
jgi:hypothetical protein